MYLYEHYRDDYDLFHLGGDDMYVIPENLKLRYAQTLPSTSGNTTTTPPIFMGAWAPHGDTKFVCGGGGYTLNQPALTALVEQSLPRCFPNTKASFEDRLVTRCLGDIGIVPRDTRDPVTAEQTYHDTDPQTLFTTEPVPPDHPKRRRASMHKKIADYWERLPHPSLPNITVGPRRGLESAAAYSVSFHKIHYPIYMARLHVLVHCELCPPSTRIGQIWRGKH